MLGHDAPTKYLDGDTVALGRPINRPGRGQLENAGAFLDQATAREIITPG